MKLILGVVLVLSIGATQGLRIAPTRLKRGIFGTITSTVFRTIEEKHYVPASCVRVAPNIPDCRNVRFLNYPGFDPNSFKFLNIRNEFTPTDLGKKDAESNIAGSVKILDFGNVSSQVTGWGEYLGFFRPIVTVTELKIRPTTVIDTRIMVTYDIRGCKPQHLPFVLDKCVDDHLEIAQILPTSTVTAHIEPTTEPSPMHISIPIIQGSENNHNQDESHDETEHL